MENFKAIEILDKLTPEIMEEIENVLQNKPKLPLDWTTKN